MFFLLKTVKSLFYSLRSAVPVDQHLKMRKQFAALIEVKITPSDFSHFRLQSNKRDEHFF